jgi:hypothetical protein
MFGVCLRVASDSRGAQTVIFGMASSKASRLPTQLGWMCISRFSPLREPSSPGKETDMKVEDAEQVFGKRWNDWDRRETIEFVQVLEPCDLNIPFTLRLAVEFYFDLTAESRKYIESLCRKAV